MKSLRFSAFLLLAAIPAPAQERGEAGRNAVINVMELSREERGRAPERQPRLSIHGPLRGPRVFAEPTVGTEPAPGAAPGEQAPPTTAAPSYTGWPGVIDDLRRMPPDSQGAVGPQHIGVMLNSEVQFQDRGGKVLSKITLDRFWSRLGPFSKTVFDPRLLYDAAGRRWLACAVADGQSPTSALLVGASQTDDPTGNWSLYRFDITNGWADYPTLGFSRNWAVVAVNVFNGETYLNTKIYAFDKSVLYAGSRAPYTGFQDSTGSLTPVVDYDNLPDRAYLAQSVRSLGGAGGMRFSEIRGAVGSESFHPGTVTVTVRDTWDVSAPNDADFAPQLGSTARIDAGDSRLQSCVLRSSSVWCAQTVFLPAGAPERTAVQWWQVNPATAQVVQRGRIDDPTGVFSYSFPSIAVNRNGDALVGYNRFSAGEYASAAFSYRAASDPVNSMQPTTVFKAGESSYRSDGTKNNRWGDYSATVVDAADDTTLWTIQEYAAKPLAGMTGRWGTWWAKVAPASAAPPPEPPAAPAPAAPRPASVVNAASFQPGPVAPGEIVSLFGTDMGPVTGQSAAAFGAVLGETRVLFDGQPAPMIYAQAGQVSAVVPFAVAGRAVTQVQVEYRGVLSPIIGVAVASAAPALFALDSSGRGPGAFLNQDGSVNSAANPAERGSIVVLYATGAGAMTPPIADGQVARPPLPVPALPVAVRIGGIVAQLAYAGAAPGLVAGALQINARVPAGAPAGSAVPVELIVGGAPSPAGVTLAIR